MFFRYTRGAGNITDKKADRMGLLEDVEKVDILRTGKPFARKSAIFGLHSFPAEATPALLQTAY